MADINLTINGQQVTVPAGATILEAAEKLGYSIPTFCHDKNLPGVASCRICVVEVAKSKNLTPACMTAARDGMVVQTESPAVVEARKTILELILANHPMDCLTCEKNGDCRLQDYCFQYGVKVSPFTGEKHTYPLEDSNPYIVRDMNKCILCGKCVRTCAQVEGRAVIDFAYDFPAIRKFVERKIISKNSLAFAMQFQLDHGGIASDINLEKFAGGQRRFLAGSFPLLGGGDPVGYRQPGQLAVSQAEQHEVGVKTYPGFFQVAQVLQPVDISKSRPFRMLSGGRPSFPLRRNLRKRRKSALGTSAIFREKPSNRALL
ncbi:MAG: (2Fe-2S)-binding protein [Firmicutes bacterium]|nr:(2Fe-2S)-binding protein [Bacillota bacterium]